MAELPVGISYGNEDHGKIRIRQGETTPLTIGCEYIPHGDEIVWKSWKGTEVPFFFSRDAQDLITKSGDEFIIGQDIIASAFFLLSGWNEYYSGDKDSHGRFPYASSIQKRLDITGKPIVNYYFDILKTVIEEASGKSIYPHTWEGKPFVLCLTHDIDTCETGWMQGGLHALKNMQFLTPIKLIYKKLSGKDAWFNFEDILRLEQFYGAPSTFFFLTTQEIRLGIKNADYNLRDPKFQRVFELLAKAGSEVGIHGSAGTYLDTEQLKDELQQFRVPVNGNRFHFLLYDPAASGRIIDECGLAYDTSLGFAEQPGFRNSFCFPFHPWDFKNDQPFLHFEIPLTLMDGTLQKYMNLKPSETRSQFEPLIEEVRKFGGCMTVLWHNTHFSEYKFAGWKEVYTQILETAEKYNAGLLSCCSVIKQYSSGESCRKLP